jgi:hypothetical protein
LLERKFTNNGVEEGIIKIKKQIADLAFTAIRYILFLNPESFLEPSSKNTDETKYIIGYYNKDHNSSQ